MIKFRNYFIIFASVFAITAACAIQDVKAQDSMSDLIKRIEALESKPSVGNVTAGKIRGLKIGLNLRHRMELRSQDFVGSSAQPTVTQETNGTRTLGSMAGRAHRTRRPSQDFTLQRMRLSFDMDVNKNVMARVMFQDSRTFGEAGITDNKERTDLQEGYVQLRNLGDINSLLTNVQLRIGRWQQGYGNHRVIGTLGWANQSRSYDGAKIMYKKGNFNVDVFAWQISENVTGGVSGSAQSDSGLGTLDPSIKDTVLYGFYSQYKFGGFLKGNVIERYVVVKAESTDEDVTNAIKTPESETRYTWGLRLAGKNIEGLGGFDYTIEPNYQSGSSRYTPANLSQNENAKENIDAWAIHAEVGYTFKNLPWTPRIGYAYSFASGDDDFDDGSQRTYKQISPTQHAHNGYMDVTSWQNIIDHQLHLNFKPTKKLVVDVKTHFFELDQESDNWYHVGGTAVNGQGADRFIDSSGTNQDVDDELGQEVDVTLKYKMFENFGVVAGYSHFFSGDFIEDTMGANDRGVDWFYLQTTVKF
jgi:hypothetical protein